MKMEHPTGKPVPARRSAALRHAGVVPLNTLLRQSVLLRLKLRRTFSEALAKENAFAFGFVGLSLPCRQAGADRFLACLLSEHPPKHFIHIHPRLRAVTPHFGVQARVNPCLTAGRRGILRRRINYSTIPKKIILLFGRISSKLNFELIYFGII